MLKQVFLIVPMTFVAAKPESAESPIRIDAGTVLKTCTSPEEAEAFVKSPQNKNKALLVLPAFEMYNNRQLNFLNLNTFVMQKSNIAEIAHTVVTAYEESAGETTLIGWSLLPELQKEAAIRKVQYHLDNPHATPAQSHRAWLDQKAVEGWGYGPLLDTEKKQDPAFVEYNVLPATHRAKDFIFRQVVHSLKVFLQATPAWEREPVAITSPVALQNVTGVPNHLPPVVDVPVHMPVSNEKPVENSNNSTVAAEPAVASAGGPDRNQH